MTNRDKLKKIKMDHNISYQDIANILDVSSHTVKSWVLPADSKTHRNMPNNLLELLEMKLNKK